MRFIFRSNSPVATHDYPGGAVKPEPSANSGLHTRQRAIASAIQQEVANLGQRLPEMDIRFLDLFSPLENRTLWFMESPPIMTAKGLRIKSRIHWHNNLAGMTYFNGVYGDINEELLHTAFLPVLCAPHMGGDFHRKQVSGCTDIVERASWCFKNRPSTVVHSRAMRTDDVTGDALHAPGL